MLGDQADHSVAALAGSLADELRHLDVLSAADRLREHRVGHVPDQDVLEGVLPLPGQAAAGARDEQILLLQVGEGLVEVDTLLGGRRVERTFPECLTDDGG